MGIVLTQTQPIQQNNKRDPAHGITQYALQIGVVIRI